MSPSARSRRAVPAQVLRQSVTDALRRGIVTRTFAPGQRLTEEAMAERYGTSRVPVREAFRALEVEGFVRVEPYAGAVVADLSDQEALDLLEVRLAVEELACRRAASRRSEGDLDQLAAVVVSARVAMAAGDTARLVELNSQFHLLLAAASGNTSLCQLLAQLRFKIEWVYAAEIIVRSENSWAEHDALVGALANGDEDRAAALMRAHIGNAQAAYSRHSAPRSPRDDR